MEKFNELFSECSMNILVNAGLWRRSSGERKKTQERCGAEEKLN